MNAHLDEVAELRRTVVDLERRLQAKTADHDETIAQKSAMAEVLEIINASAGDLAPIFDAIAERAARLCDAHGAFLWIADNDVARLVGRSGTADQF